MILVIQASGLIILFSMVVAVASLFIWGWLRKDTNGIDNQVGVEPNVRQILFNLENNTNEEMWVDLVRLEQTDKYSFNTSDGNYGMLVEYLKTFSFNVVKTTVNYQHEDWQKDIIYNFTYTPFGITQKSVFVGFDNFYEYQQQRNFIEAKSNYSFDFFNTLMVKLNPNEKKAITLDVSEQASDIEVVAPKCALLLKNISDETQVVKLFNKEYYAEVENKGAVEIESVFNQVSYIEVLKHFDSFPLTAKKIKMFIGMDNIESTFKINFDEEKIIDCMSDDQEQDEVIVKDLGSETFIACFEVELKPNTEMYISFK